MTPFKTIEHELVLGIEGELEKAGVDYTATVITHSGAATGETRKITYVSPKTGETVYVKAVYKMYASDGIWESLAYYDADFEGNLDQHLADVAGNAACLRDSRLSEWEHSFICNLIDKRLLDDVSLLSDKQQALIRRIAEKVRGPIEYEI